MIVCYHISLCAIPLCYTTLLYAAPILRQGMTKYFLKIVVKPHYSSDLSGLQTEGAARLC